MTDKKRSAPPEARAILDALEARIGPAASRRNLMIVAAIVAAALYFLAAFFLDVSYVDTAPKDKNAAHIVGPYRLIDGFWTARVWIVAKDGPVTIYENGISLGRAHDSYRDVSEKFVADGKRWDIVEFYSASDPNANGHRYWAVRH